MAVMTLGFCNDAIAQSVKTAPKSSQVAKKKTMPKVNKQTVTVAPKKSSATVTKKAPASSATNKQQPSSDSQNKKVNPKSTFTNAKVFPRTNQETKIKIEDNRAPAYEKKEPVQKSTKQ